MTAQEAKGAGTGAQANLTRSREYNETVPGAAPVKQVGGSYPVGDAVKGRIDPDNPDAPIAMRDRRAYLIDQAEKNEAANDELNAIQTDQNRRAMEGFNKIGSPDPDEQRESSMETAVAALKMHDPESRKKATTKSTKGGSSKAGVDQTSADFKAGQASG